MEVPKFLTTKEVAALLRMQPQTLEKARSTGLGPVIPYIKANRKVLYSLTEVLKWIDKNKIEGI